MCGAILPHHHTSSLCGTWLSTGTTLPLPFTAKERIHSVDLGMDGRIILKLIEIYHKYVN